MKYQPQSMYICVVLALVELFVTFSKKDNQHCILAVPKLELVKCCMGMWQNDRSLLYPGVNMT
jgi:hypothetical protein